MWKVKTPYTYPCKESIMLGYLHINAPSIYVRYMRYMYLSIVLFAEYKQVSQAEYINMYN